MTFAPARRLKALVNKAEAPWLAYAGGGSGFFILIVHPHIFPYSVTEYKGQPLLVIPAGAP